MGFFFFICAGIASIACCCCSSSTKLCCVTTSATASRVSYVVMFTISAAVAWIMLAASIGEALNSQSSFTGEIAECEADESSQQCGARWSQLAVLRVMFGAFLFFGFMGMIMCGVANSHDTRSAWQNGFWFFKVLLWIGLTVAAFFIDNDWYTEWWGYFGLAGAFLYLLIQGYYIIIWAHKWASKYKSDDCGRAAYTVPLVAFSSLIFTLVITVILFVYYTYGESRGGCERNKVLISINLVLSVVMIIAGLLSIAEERGLLQPSLLSAYTTYLTWSAVSQTTDQCLPRDNDPSDWLTLVVGFFLTIWVILSMSTIYRDPEARDVSGHRDSVEKGEDGNESGPKMYTPYDNEESGVQYNWSSFHWMIALACCFMQNVLTNWVTIRTSSGGASNPEVDAGDSIAPIWIQAVAGYIVVAMYLIDVTAPSCGPICCPGREWGSASTRV